MVLSQALQPNSGPPHAADARRPRSRGTLLHGCAAGAGAAVAARMTRYCSSIRRLQGTDSACHVISANPPTILPKTINAALALLTDPCLQCQVSCVLLKGAHTYIPNQAMQALIDLPHLILAPGSTNWKQEVMSAPDSIPDDHARE